LILGVWQAWVDKSRNHLLERGGMLVGNILSYMRIAAIGLASVYLAKVANEMVGLVGSLLVGIIAAGRFLAFNLIMAVFSPTIHSLCLYYVEFFRKFYDGGGKPWRCGCGRWREACLDR